MSAQCYTNKRRILAEAALKKVQYPGRVALNNKLILSALNCSSDFTPITYTQICKCSFNGRGLPSNPYKVQWILDGGNFLTNSLNIIDGGTFATNPPTILDGNS